MLPAKFWSARGIGASEARVHLAAAASSTQEAGAAQPTTAHLGEVVLAVLSRRGRGHGHHAVLRTGRQAGRQAIAAPLASCEREGGRALAARPGIGCLHSQPRAAAWLSMSCREPAAAHASPAVMLLPLPDSWVPLPDSWVWRPRHHCQVRLAHDILPLCPAARQWQC
jgi:hypothetical protein